jgi:hypothetical protein
MSKVNENNGSAMGAFQHRDTLRGLPWGGAKGDFNFVMGRSQFTPGISIKLLPLSDMSHKGGDAGISEFDYNVNIIKQYYKPGDRVRGILVNSQLNKDNGRTVIGKLTKVEINRRDHTIKIYIHNPETLEEQEIYVDTMERIFESKYRAMNFSEFLGS